MTITKNLWANLSESEIADAQQNYANTFSSDPSFLEFIIFGKQPVKQMLKVPGCKGLKIKIGLIENAETETQQLYPILVPVDSLGNELPFEYQPDGGEIQARGGGDSNPVKCPVSCG